MTVGIKTRSKFCKKLGELNQGSDSTKTKDLVGSSSFTGDMWNIMVIRVNGETGLVEVKISAWAKMNDKAWHVWMNAKGSSCLPCTG